MCDFYVINGENIKISKNYDALPLGEPALRPA